MDERVVSRAIPRHITGMVTSFARALHVVVAAVIVALACPAVHAQAAKSGVHFVVVVRHGSYDREPGAHDDRTQNGLNAVGHKQAKLVGERLAHANLHVDHLVSSELLRAKQTADDIGAALKLTATRDALLNECTPSTGDAAFDAREGSARLAACDQQMAALWQRLFAATPEHDVHDVVVGHGNVIRWLLLRALGADPKQWASLDVGNASITVFAVFADGVVRVVPYDDVGHLPIELQTWTGRGVGSAGR